MMMDLENAVGCAEELTTLLPKSQSDSASAAATAATLAGT